MDGAAYTVCLHFVATCCTQTWQSVHTMIAQVQVFSQHIAFVRDRGEIQRTRQDCLYIRPRVSEEHAAWGEASRSRAPRLAGVLDLLLLAAH